MYPLVEDVLSLLELARHWARDVPQRPAWEEAFARLAASVWLGELEVVHRPGQLDTRRRLLEALVRLSREQGVAIFPDARSVPDNVKPQPDGTALVDTRTFVILPKDEASWDIAVIDAACAILAKTNPEVFSLSFRTILSMQMVTREAFERYCLARAYPLPPFWFSPRRRRVSTAKAKLDCAKWLRQLVAAGDKPASKESLWQEAKRAFPRLTKRAFDEAWAGTVPEDWRGAGAPRGSRTPRNPKGGAPQ